MPKQSRLKWWAIAGLTIVIVLWVANLLVFQTMKAEERGTYGDMFGAVNALFSGLAFLGVIIAILMQREELQLQRADLALQRKELELTREEMKAQTESFKRQNFEATFFQLLRLHNEMVESVTLLPEGQNISGRHAFQGWWSKVLHGSQQTLEGYLENLRTRIQPHVGHYFRNLYHVVLFVHERAEPDRRTLYARLVRAQLSRYEALILCYNCLSEFGNEKFKPLVEQYALLKGVEDQIPAEHRELFAASAFGEK